jgi:hypothetical protein
VPYSPAGPEARSSGGETARRETKDARGHKGSHCTEDRRSNTHHGQTPTMVKHPPWSNTHHGQTPMVKHPPPWSNAHRTEDRRASRTVAYSPAGPGGGRPTLSREHDPSSRLHFSRLNVLHSRLQSSRPRGSLIRVAHGSHTRGQAPAVNGRGKFRGCGQTRRQRTRLGCRIGFVVRSVLASQPPREGREPL